MSDLLAPFFAALFVCQAPTLVWQQQSSHSPRIMATNPNQLPPSVLVRKSCVAKSTERQASMYPKASAEKYDMMSPNSQASVIACAEAVTKVLKGRMATRAVTAQKRLFNGQQPGTSEQHGAQPKKPRVPEQQS